MPGWALHVITRVLRRGTQEKVVTEDDVITRSRDWSDMARSHGNKESIIPWMLQKQPSLPNTSAKG